MKISKQEVKLLNCLSYENIVRENYLVFIDE